MGSFFFISTFLSSVSPTYLWIRHAFWDLPCLQGFHQEIYPRNFGQHSLTLSLSLSLSLSLPPVFSIQHPEKTFLSWGDTIYIYINMYMYTSQFACKSFELVCRAARTRQEAGASWFSPTWCFSTVNIPKRFLLIQHRVWHLVFNLDFSIFSIPKAIC